MRKNGRGGRGGMPNARQPTEQERRLMQQLHAQRVAPEARAIGKDVNTKEARPAFEKFPPLDYSEYRREMLTQRKAD